MTTITAPADVHRSDDGHLWWVEVLPQAEEWAPIAAALEPCETCGGTTDVYPDDPDEECDIGMASHCSDCVDGKPLVEVVLPVQGEEYSGEWVYCGTRSLGVGTVEALPVLRDDESAPPECLMFVFRSNGEWMIADHRDGSARTHPCPVVCQAGDYVIHFTPKQKER